MHFRFYEGNFLANFSLNIPQIMLFNFSCVNYVNHFLSRWVRDPSSTHGFLTN